MKIFTKFHKDWTTIVDFLLIAKFWASLLFFYSPSKYIHIKNIYIFDNSIDVFFFWKKILIVISSHGNENMQVEGESKKSRKAQNLAINKKSTIVVQSL